MKKAIELISRLCIILAVIIFFSVAYLLLHITNKNLEVSSYSIETNIENPIRIVQLSDLHNAEFGEQNEDLIKLVQEQKPDLIVMTGDMINRDDENLNIICNLISSLSEIAPVYYGYGNHEYSWIQTYGDRLSDCLTAAGAAVVNNEYQDTPINGNAVRIGGYMGYYRQPGMFIPKGKQFDAEIQFANDFENTTDLKILLDHIPTAWVDWGYINKYPVNIVFSGHYHGGQWVLPIIGAVYAPYVGFNPPYAKGVFTGEKATCVLSAGLGNEYDYLPRVNNPPEIVVVDLIPQN